MKSSTIPSFPIFLNIFLIVFLPIWGFSQAQIVKGTVSLNDKSTPGVGVNVLIKGTSLGTIADIDGNYQLNVPNTEAILVFSYIGYASQEITVGNNTVIDVVLAEGVQLQEYVTTALGIKKEKSKLGYVAQEISGEPLQKATEANVATSLTGRIAGLAVSTKSTLYENPEILLRGKPTLVVIDGVPTKTDFWNINANDIESVNVLKGTAAAALYGALGVNGAIMITTKKGKSDNKDGVEISVNSSTQFQAGYIRIPETQDQYGMGWNGQYGFVDGKGGGLFDDYGYVYGPKLNVADATTKSGFIELPQYNSPIDPTTGKRVPLPWITRSSSNLNKFLRNELLTTNNVSIAGKSGNGNYRISLSHLYQQGQVPNTQLNSTTATVSGGLQLNKRIKMEATASYNRQYSPNYPSAGYGADNYFYNILLWMGPDLDINDLRDYWQPGKKDIQQNTFNYTWYNNPWYLAHEYLKQYTNDVIVGQTNLTWDFTDDLKFLIRTGVTNSSVFTDRKTPYSFIYYSAGASPQGNYQIDQSSGFQIISDALLTYNKTFAKDFDLTLSAGASHRFSSNSGLSSRTVGLNIPGYFNLANSISPVQTTNGLTEKEVKSAFGYADFGYKHMIYIGITGRNDWTSALQTPYNSFFYPSATAAVIVSEMLKLPKWFSYLKLRGAWANISTDPDPYYTLPTYSTGIRWNGNLSLQRPGSLIAPDILPNQTISQEYGLELKFFGNRLGADLTYYNYIDKNFIINAPVSLASGFASRLVNGGEINRKGFELTLTATPVKFSDFRWDITTNFSQARSYRNSYYGGETILDGVKIGERTDVYRGWAWQRSPDGKIVTIAGRPQYIDHPINLGFADPDWVMGVSNQISWKGLTFAFLIDGRLGGKMINGVEAKLYEGGMHPATANAFRDDSYAGKATYLLDGVEVTDGTATWDVQGKLTEDTRKFAPNAVKVKYIDHLFDTYVNGIDEAVLYDRTFVKLREVTLTYTIPTSLLKSLPVKEANISVVGRNLLLWSKVPFMDPDGYNYYSLAEPTYRNIGVNVNVKF